MTDHKQQLKCICSETDTVLDLKKQVEVRSGLPVAEQSMQFCGELMENGKLLLDFPDAANEMTVRVCLRGC